MNEPSPPRPKGEFLIYQTEDHQSRIQCRLHGETIWLSQEQLAELYQTGKPNIVKHLASIEENGEVNIEASIHSWLTDVSDGTRRPVKFYNLDVILALGYRVRSHRGVQFRRSRSNPPAPATRSRRGTKRCRAPKPRFFVDPLA